MSAHRGEPRQSEPGSTTKFNVTRYTLCPRITLAVDGIEFSALVDTGAGRSIISESVVELLNGKYTINNSEEVELYDASNNKMNSRGTILLKVRYQDYIMEQEFVIMSKISKICILGMDAIEKHNFVINGKEKTIYINEVKRDIEIIGVNRDNEVKREIEIIGINRDNEVKQETEIIGLNRDNKVKQETEIIGDNVSKIMLTTAADVTIRPFEMLPCYVVNDQDIDKKDKLTIHSIFDENNLVEKPCAEEIIEESETKDIFF